MKYFHIKKCCILVSFFLHSIIKPGISLPKVKWSLVHFQVWAMQWVSISAAWDKWHLLLCLPEKFSDSSDNDADVFLCRDLPTISLMETHAYFLAKKKNHFWKQENSNAFIKDGQCKQSMIFSTSFLLCSVAAIKWFSFFTFFFFFPGSHIDPTLENLMQVPSGVGVFKVVRVSLEQRVQALWMHS